MTQETNMGLTDEQLERYQRHIILPDIGGAGQMAISHAHILVIGAGGIGCPALAYLAAAGVGQITILDDDVVDLSNLQRQILFSSDDIGTPKAIAAQTSLARINPNCTVSAKQCRFDAAFCKCYRSEKTLQKYDVILDGCDNFVTRLLVNQFAMRHHIPLVSAALGPFDGQLASYFGWQKNAPCYQCLVGDNPDRDALNCAEQGILGAVAGIMGSMAAMETLRIITGFGTPQAGKLQVMDFRNMVWRTMSLPPDPKCTACKSHKNNDLKAENTMS